MKYSTVLAVLDSEATLPDAIRSVADTCDDVVVVIDDRTRDKSAEVAKHLGARVYERTFDGFATQKNFGIDKAKHDWILILDDDERLSGELQKAIADADGSAHVAFKFALRNYLGRKWLRHGGLYPDYHVRIFNKHKARYEGREVHEELQIDGPIGTIPGDLIHLTYDNARQYLQKVRKYSVLQAKEDRKNKKVGHLRQPVRATLGEFVFRYIKLSGWRDGWAGLESAVLLSYYSFRYWRELSR